MSNQIRSIQILRGIAAILVVYAHSIDLAYFLKKDSLQGSFKFLQNFGAIGVDIFFVISGFIMAYVTKKLSGAKDSISFLKKRFIRIYTLYLPLTVLLILYKHPDIHTIVKDITLLPLMDKGDKFVPLTIAVAWTLSFEMFFYLTMAFFITISKQKHLYATIATLGICSFTGIFYHFSEVHLVFLTNPILLEFVFGLIIGWIYIRKTQVPGWLVLLLLTAAISWFIVLIFNGYGDISEANFTLDATLSFKRVVLWGIPSALFVTAFVFIKNSYPKINMVFENRLLLLLGDSSYSIYLIHTILFSSLISISRFLFISLNGDLLVLLFLTIAAAIGCFVYKFIEKPLLTLLQKEIAANKK